MNKEQYLKERVNKLKGCVIDRVETKVDGDNVSLVSIHLRCLSGDEFIIKPFDCFQLHAVQTLWGE